MQISNISAWYSPKSVVKSVKKVGTTVAKVATAPTVAVAKTTYKVAKKAGKIVWDKAKLAALKLLFPLIKKICAGVVKIPRPVLDAAAAPLGVDPNIPVLFCKAFRANNANDIVRLLPPMIKLAAALGFPPAAQVMAVVNKTPILSTMISFAGAVPPQDLELLRDADYESLMEGLGLLGEAEVMGALGADEFPMVPDVPMSLQPIKPYVVPMLLGGVAAGVGLWALSRRSA